MLSDTFSMNNQINEEFDTNSVFKKLQYFEPKRKLNSVCSDGNAIMMEQSVFNDVEYTLGYPEQAIDFELDDLATWTDQECGERSI